MKKFLAVFLALAMVFAMSSMAMAANPMTAVTAPNNSDAGDVSVSVNVTTPGKVYHVLIKWSDMSFTYETGGTTWNPETHTYEVTDGSWTDDAAEVLIENHSNKGVNYTVAYAGANGVGADIKINDVATFTGSLDSADSDTYRTADKSEINDSYTAGDMDTITLTATGKPNTSDVTVGGTVTITIAEV